MDLSAFQRSMETRCSFGLCQAPAQVACDVAQGGVFEVFAVA